MANDRSMSGDATASFRDARDARDARNRSSCYGLPSRYPGDERNDTRVTSQNVLTSKGNGVDDGASPTRRTSTTVGVASRDHHGPTVVSA